MQIDLRVTRLLCSVICHDVVNKLMNLSLGLENFNASEDQLSSESLQLIAHEGEMAMKQLSFFRVSLGNGTGETGLTGLGGIEEARKLAASYLAIHNVTLNWNAEYDNILEPAASRLSLKLLLNTLHCASMCVFRNGEISLHIEKIDNDIGILITGKSSVARLRTDFVRALRQECGIDDLTAQTAIPWYTACLAQENSSEVDANDAGDSIQFALLLPAAS